MFSKGNPHGFKSNDPRRNAGGRPSFVKALEEAGLNAKDLRSELVKRLHLMLDSRDPRERTFAMGALLDRLFGRVAQQIEVETTLTDSEYHEELDILTKDRLSKMTPSEREKLLTEIDHPGANVTDQ